MAHCTSALQTNGYFRKRSHTSGDAENGILGPQAKRCCQAGFCAEPSWDVWDSESSVSASSSTGSPEHAAETCGGRWGPCSPIGSASASDPVGPYDPASYLHINRILKEAHFHSLRSHGQHIDQR